MSSPMKNARTSGGRLGWLHLVRREARWRLRLLRTYANGAAEGLGLALLSRMLRGHRLLDDVPGARGVDLHARTHGGGHRHRTDVAALGRRRLGPDQLIDHRRVVLQKLAAVEVSLADDQVDDGVAVGAVLDLAC